MADISSIKLPNGTTYNIKDANASTATNWLNGSASGSVRTINSAEEDANYTIGVYAVAEGNETKASGESSHAEGLSTTASAVGSHAEGGYTTASGSGAHAEGYNTTASANYGSHAEGYYTTASGQMSHSEGRETTASGSVSHAGGRGTIANHLAQHVFGKYNIADPSTAASNANGNYIEIVGNGTADNARSNARTLDWDGNEVLAGTITATNIPAPPNSNGTYYLTVTINNGSAAYNWSSLPIYDGTVTTS